MAPAFNPFEGVPNLTGYSRPKDKTEPSASTVSALTVEQLAWIFRPLERDLMEKFALYTQDCSDAFYARAFKSNTYAEFKAYLFAYRSISRGLERLEVVHE